MSEQPPQDPDLAPPGPASQDPAPQDPAPHNPYQPYAPGYGPTGLPMWAPDHPQATTVLLLGILGMAVCQVVAPFAWVMGSRVRKEIDASGGRIGGRSQVQIGYVLGIIGSCLLIFYVLGGIAYFGVVIAAIAAGA